MSVETLSFFSTDGLGSLSTGLSGCEGADFGSSVTEELCSVSKSSFWSGLVFLNVLFEFNLPRIDWISLCRPPSPGEDNDNGGSEVSCSAVLCSSSVPRLSFFAKTAAISSPSEYGSSFSSTIGSVGDAAAKLCSELSIIGYKSEKKFNRVSSVQTITVNESYLYIATREPALIATSCSIPPAVVMCPVH